MMDVDDAVLLESDEVIDQLVVDFDTAKERKDTELFNKILKCDRNDDVSLKIKEQCIIWYDLK